MDGRATGENKAVSLQFSGAVWTGLEGSFIHAGHVVCRDVPVSPGSHSKSEGG